MSTRRIYLEGLKETDENADKKIYAVNNYSGYNRVSIRRKRSLYVKKLFAGFFSIIMILGLSAFYGSGLVSAHDNARDNSKHSDSLWRHLVEYLRRKYVR